jgi:hypothetical protein
LFWGSFTQSNPETNTTVIVFTSSGSGSCTFTVPDRVFYLDYLVVGGGGGAAGGGGGGTDPDGYDAGSGGGGTVIIRYQIPDADCANDGTHTHNSRPLACPGSLVITAGEAAKTLDVRGNPISYSDTSTSVVSLVAAPSGMSVTGTTSFSFVVSSASSSLRGGTYPVIYQLRNETNGTPSESYVLVTVNDPDQHTPRTVLVDPRLDSILLPNVIVGTLSAVQVCITPDTSTASYSNRPTISLTSSGSETVTTLTNGALRIVGSSNAVVQNAMQYLKISKHSSERYLVTNGASRRLTVNVSNTAAGGNGSCTFGTSSTIDLNPLDLSQKIRQGTVNGNKHGQ